MSPCNWTWLQMTQSPQLQDYNMTTFNGQFVTVIQSSKCPTHAVNMSLVIQKSREMEQPSWNLNWAWHILPKTVQETKMSHCLCVRYWHLRKKLKDCQTHNLSIKAKVHIIAVCFHSEVDSDNGRSGIYGETAHRADTPFTHRLGA